MFKSIGRGLPMSGKVAVSYMDPPPCLWHQVRVHRVLSAPAGSGPAGLGGNPASLPNSGADPA